MKYKISLMVFVIIIFAASAQAQIQFNDEEIFQDITTFRWCFSPGWEDVSLYKDKLNVYTDNMGCDITQKNLYAVTPVIITDGDCKKTPDTCVTTPEWDFINSSWTFTTSCKKNPDTCKDKIIMEKYDLEKTDYLFPKGSRICYEAKRRAKTGQSNKCDMNFRTEVDGQQIDVKNFGKAWWNATWNRKYPITVQFDASFQVYNARPFRLDFNTTLIDMDDCQADGGDVRILDSTETTQLGFNLSLWNTTHGVVYVNDTLSNTTNSSYFLYCNASTPQTTTSVSLLEINLADELQLYYNLDEGALGGDSPNSVSDQSGLIETGSVGGTGGIADSSRGSFSTGNYLSNLTGDMVLNVTISLWALKNDTLGGTDTLAGTDWDSVSGQPMFNIFEDGSGVQLYCYASDGSPPYTKAVGIATPAQDAWYHIVGRCYQDAAEQTSTIYVNGSLEQSVNVTWTPSQVYDEFGVGILTTAGRANPADAWIVDEVAVWNRSLSDDEITVLNNQMQSLRYTSTSDGFFASPTYTVGGGASFAIDTVLDAGLFDTQYNNISLTVNEREEFFIWANYTIQSNGSVINDTQGFCNYSSDNILDPFSDLGSGVNTTICTSGCDFSNKTVVFDGLPLDGYIDDFYEMGICHQANPARSVTISTNCSVDIFIIPFQNIPLCGVGVLNVSINSANCSGQSSVELSVWSAATAEAHATRLVDDTLTINRRHNHTDDMIFNSTLQLWNSDDPHLYEVHGSEVINVSCFENVSGNIANQSVGLDITVVNIPPTVLIDDIWWWLLSAPVEFVDSRVAKYPLESTLNVTSQCVDDDVDTVIHYLNFSNGSNIDTFDAGGLEGSQLNFTQGNFSTDTDFLDGVSGYVFQTWCNDTTNNVTTVQRSFTAENDIPVVVWSNVSGQSFGNTPINFSWECSDDENESMISFLYLNGTLNQSGSDDFFVFNGSQGSYSMNVSCADTFRNSTNQTLNFEFTQACVIQVVSPCAGCRYQDNNVSLQFNCSNNIIPDSCAYFINDFANSTLMNCTDVGVNGVDITAELGWNRLTVSTLNGGVSASSEINFWTKKQDSSILDYPVILFFLIAGLVFMLMATFTRVPFIHIVSAFIFAFAGYELIAFSAPLGFMVILASLLYGIVMVLSGLND